MSSSYDAIREEAAAWVRAAGVIACERFGTVDVWQKADRSPVTDADHEAQDALLEAIGRAYPDDAVITEETQAAPDRHQQVTSARRCWVVDPIDGTRNYARGLPVFTVSVALMEAGLPVVGIVYEPLTGRMYHAVAGGGAWVDDRRIQAPQRDETGEVFLSIPTSRHEELPPAAHRWIDTYVVRNLGSTALHLALLATGALDAVYCRRSKLWDIAAGALIAAETGAEIRSTAGAPCFPMELARYTHGPMPFIAARPPLLERLLTEYQRAGSLP